jgi:outer membrane protein
MNRKHALLAALVAGLLPVALIAQATSPEPQPAAPAASAPATAQPAAPPPPQAYPAKIALVNFIEAVEATNEGQRAAADVQKKYAPQKEKLDALATEIDSLKKQLQAAPATLSDEDRAARLKTIDTKDKQYQRDAEDASNSYQSDIQEALGKIAQKVHAVMVDYVAKNGYTLLLGYGEQQSPVLWAAATPNNDITEAIVEAYNTSSGVTAPPPAAPTAARKPASTTTPHTTTPKPAPKP